MLQSTVQPVDSVRLGCFCDLAKQKVGGWALWGRVQLAETSLQHEIRFLRAEGILEIMLDYHLTDNPPEIKTRPCIQHRDEWLVLFMKE